MDTKKIEELLKSIASDVLTEDVKASIAKVFTEAVEEKVKSQTQLVVENELSKMDEDHTAKMQKLVEAIDADHTSKFRTVIEQIDKAHTQKLQKVMEKYETELKEGAEKLRGELIGKISNYLDLYLAEVIPSTQLKEAVENIRARKMVNEIKKIIAVDPEFVNENFKEALKDGHDTIEKLRSDVNEKIKESMELKQQLLTTQATLLMEQKTRDLPENKKKFVTRLLEGKKPEEIEKNFQFVLEMYDRDETEKVEQAKKTATTKSKVLTEKVDAPQAKTIVEDTKSDVVDSTVVSYLEGLKNV